MTTARNTRIARSRLGEVRFPPHPPEPPGRIETYFMSREEIFKRYGPPKRPVQRNYNGSINYRSIIAAIRTCEGPAAAAELLGLSLEDFQEYIRRYQIQPRYNLALKERGFDEEMDGMTDDINDNGANSDNNSVPENNGNESGNPQNDTSHDPEERKAPEKLTRAWLAEELKTRTVAEIQADFPKVMLFAKKWGLVERVRPEELLSREKLAECKQLGMTDREIMKASGLRSWDFYKLKKQYGLGVRTKETAPPEKDAPDPAPSAQEERRETPPAAGCLTIARVLEIREEVIEDRDDLARIIDLVTKNQAILPSGRVMSLLAWYRDHYQALLDRIDLAFETNTVAI